MKKIFKLKKKNAFELLFLSLAISSFSCIFLSLALIAFALPIVVVLPSVTPVWVGSTTLIFMAWKER